MASWFQQMGIKTWSDMGERIILSANDAQATGFPKTKEWNYMPTIPLNIITKNGLMP